MPICVSPSYITGLPPPAIGSTQGTGSLQSGGCRNTVKSRHGRFAGIEIANIKFNDELSPSRPSRTGCGARILLPPENLMATTSRWTGLLEFARRTRTWLRNIPWGKSVPLDAHRTMICDLLHFAQQVPTIPVQRRMNVAALVQARSAALHRPSWCLIFTKTFALVAQRVPELRRAYLHFPRERLYEHPESVASISVERLWGGKRRLAFAKLSRPETRPLAVLDRYLQRFIQAPEKNMGVARFALALGRLWRPLRLAIWWLGLNLSGTFKGRRLGTFGVSVYSSLGAESLHPLAPLSYVVNYGVIQPNGDVDVRIIYDHRVLDGATVARVLAEIEETLHGELLTELRQLRGGVKQLDLALS